jgi:hypothetical protein
MFTEVVYPNYGREKAGYTSVFTPGSYDARSVSAVRNVSREAASEDCREEMQFHLTSYCSSDVISIRVGLNFVNFVL